MARTKAKLIKLIKLDHCHCYCMSIYVNSLTRPFRRLIVDVIPKFYTLFSPQHSARDCAVAAVPPSNRKKMKKVDEEPRS